MSKITLFGAHGKIALLSIPKLVEQGHEVVGVIRDPEQSDDLLALGARPAVASIEGAEPEVFDTLIGNSDAVIWSAGAGGGSPLRTRAVDQVAAIASMDAAQRVGAHRYVMVSYFGSAADHGIPSDNSFYDYAEAKFAADEHLRSSSLDWTILMPSRLTDDPPSGSIEVGIELGSKSVSRADVAEVLAQVIGDEGTVRKSYPFNTGSTPIGTYFGVDSR